MSVSASAAQGALGDWEPLARFFEGGELQEEAFKQADISDFIVLSDAKLVGSKKSPARELGVDLLLVANPKIKARAPSIDYTLELWWRRGGQGSDYDHDPLVILLSEAEALSALRETHPAIAMCWRSAQAMEALRQKGFKPAGNLIEARSLARATPAPATRSKRASPRV